MVTHKKREVRIQITGINNGGLMNCIPTSHYIEAGCNGCITTDYHIAMTV